MEYIETLLGKFAACIIMQKHSEVREVKEQILSEFKGLKAKLNMKYANTHMEDLFSLFEFMSDEHDLTLTDTEMQDIVGCVVRGLEK